MSQIKDIPGYLGYRADTEGNIWSCWERIHEKGLCGSKYIMGEKWHKLGQCDNGHGYLSVQLGVGRRRNVHRLVALTFLPNPENKKEAAHLDGVKANNKLENLCWATRKENEDHKKIHGTRLRGEQVYNAILKESDVILIKELLRNSHMTCRRIGEIFNTTGGNIENIKYEHTWKYVT